VTHLTDNPEVFQVFGKPVVMYCEFTLQNQPKNLATAKQVPIDTAMRYCEVRMGGLVILPNRERRQCSSTQYRVCDMVRHRCSHLLCIDELWYYSSGPLSTLALVLVVVFEVRVVVLVWEGLVVPLLGDVAGHGH